MKEPYVLVASDDQLDTKIAEMAKQIVQGFPTDQPLFVALQRGAAPFASKLMFEIVRQSPEFHPELDYLTVSTYGSGQVAGEPRVVSELSPTTIVKDREVIVLDDVLDKGITAKFVFDHLQALGAKNTLLAVLAQKDVRRTYDIVPDYCGFELGDKWLVGMGMDDAATAHEGYRWLDAIYEKAQ